MDNKLGNTVSNALQAKESDWRRIAGATLLLVFACFTLSSSGYLAWLYHLMAFVPPESVDALTMGAGYACQGIGLGIAVAIVRIRPEALGRVSFVVLVAFLFACAAPASLSDTLGGTLVFGYAMNLLIGAVSAYYLIAIALLVGERHRGVVFGGGYACSIVASWLVSLIEAPFADVPTNIVSCAVFSVVAVGIVMAAPFLTETTGTAKTAGAVGHDDGLQAPKPLPSAVESTFSAQQSRSIVALACLTVLLMSMVKNMGFNFPTADIGVAVNLELSRLFYAVGLVIAGIVIGRNRKLGAILCMAALVIPFVLMALEREPVPSVALWAIDYFFYGFFSVFRVVLFADLAMRFNQPYLAGFGLLLGHFGDALGVIVSLSLGGSALALVSVTAVLFAAIVFVFYQLFLLIYTLQSASPERNEREVFDAFAAHYELSPREREMMRQVLDGKTNAEAAANLFVSESTVKFHMRNLLKKTDCKNRVDLLAKYAEESNR